MASAIVIASLLIPHKKEKVNDPAPPTPADTPQPPDSMPSTFGTPLISASSILISPVSVQLVPASTISTPPAQNTISTAVIRTRNSRRNWIQIHKDDYKELWYWRKNVAGRATRLWGSIYENNDQGRVVRRSRRLKKTKGTKVIGLICM